MPEITVTAIPALSDNYIWLISTGGKQCAIVDPGEAAPVSRVLEKLGLDLRYILLTHHHPDHIGGVQQLRQNHDVEVWAPEDSRIPYTDHVCRQGDRIALPGPDLEFGVIEHTHDVGSAGLKQAYNISL